MGDEFVTDAETCDLLIEYYRTGSGEVRGRMAEIVAGKRRLEERGRAVFVVQMQGRFRKAA